MEKEAVSMAVEARAVEARSRLLLLRHDRDERSWEKREKKRNMGYAKHANTKHKVREGKRVGIYTSRSS